MGAGERRLRSDELGKRISGTLMEVPSNSDVSKVISAPSSASRFAYCRGT